MTIFFTSDTHFGHANIIKYCHRPFTTVEDMDAELILRWNEVVSDRDTVYHLGDFCLGNPTRYLRQLNGDIQFVRGNHDDNLAKLYKNLPYLRVIKLPTLKDGHHISLTLCHYAMRSWQQSHYGHWHLFGHHHGNLPAYGKSFDIGVDAWNFYPVSLVEVRDEMNMLTPIVDYSMEKP